MRGLAGDRERDALGAALHVGQRKAPQGSVHDQRPSRADADAVDPGALAAPDEAGAQDGQVEGVRIRVAPTQPLLPCLRDGVTVAALEVTLEGGVLGQLAAAAAPVVDAERADQDETPGSDARHGPEQPLGRQNGLLELLQGVAREGRRQMDHRVHTRQQRLEVRAAQVAPAHFDARARRGRLHVGDGAHQRAHGMSLQDQRFRRRAAEEAPRSRQQDLHVPGSSAVRSRTSRLTASIWSGPIGAGAPVRSAV